jgi:DNA-binding LacI/PurR family transcriptional regulator
VTTIARVALEAGVGVGTVSRVINGSAAVREETRRRVLDVISELGFEPNAAARALSTGRTGAVGVIAPFFTTPSVIERLRGVVRELAECGHQLILFAVERPEQREAAFRSALGRVDGLLAISLSPTDDELAPLTAAGLPVVLVDHDHPGLPCVTIDDVAGGRLATEHLLALGHERIAFVGDLEGGAHDFTSSGRRRTGYEQALAAAGAPAPRELQRLDRYGRDQAAAVTRALLALPEPPTAIFAASDVQALGALEAADALGVPVPGRLSVVGFDDVELARYAGLTTVAQPLEESGARGVDLLLEALDGATGSGLRLPLELVVRGTTAEPGGGRSTASAHAGGRGAAGQPARLQ